ncbi:MAG: hypothetical protein KIS66_07390 [Fimbriimonadaceae bacterium]|nr:hypothetical protein [Fimbriimonadaceae bacterium]
MVRTRFVALFVVLALGGAAGAQTPGKKVALDRKEGTHAVVARVGDTLTFETTYLQSGSTGYQWHGPKLEGDKVFGKVGTVFVKAKDFDKKKKAAEGQHLPPGAPAPDLGKSYATIPIVKTGKARATFVFSRFDVDGARQEGDKVCVFEVTVRARRK